MKKPSLRSLEGKTIGGLARERKLPPWDVFLDLGLDDDLDTLFDCRLFNGVRTVDPRGVILDCGRPGRVLREFAD